MTTIAAAVASPHRWVRWTLVIVWMAVIFWFSSQTRIEVPVAFELGLGSISRKLGHVAVYAVLTILVAWALPPSRYRLVIAVAFAVLYGLTDELHQSFRPPREARLLDVGIDAIGALLGAAVFRGVHGRSPRRGAGGVPQHTQDPS
jgi:VanZ family protein